MKSRKQISQQLGMSEQYLSMLLRGERKISWPLSQKLAELFPGKDMVGWKNATPEDLKRAFSQLEYNGVV